MAAALRTPQNPRPFGRVLAAFLLAGAMLLVLAATASADGIAPSDAHSPNAADMRTSYWVMLIVIVLLGAALIGGLVSAVIRNRDGGDEAPRRITAGRGLIGRVAGGLSVVALAIFIFGIVMTEKTLEADAEDEARTLQIGVVGQQWLWRFEYPAGEREDISETFSYNELVVPVDTRVELSIDSTDVLHRWFIPELGPQVDAVPGEVTTTWFEADEVGTYRGQSTQFSGTSYPAMRATVEVVSKEDYDTYLTRLADDLRAAQEAVTESVRAAEEGDL